ETRPWVVRLWMGNRDRTVSVRKMRSGARRDGREVWGTGALGWVTMGGLLSCRMLCYLHTRHGEWCLLYSLLYNLVDYNPCKNNRLGHVISPVGTRVFLP